jgi:hypothetical protein
MKKLICALILSFGLSTLSEKNAVANHATCQCVYNHKNYGSVDVPCDANCEFMENWHDRCDQVYGKDIHGQQKWEGSTDQDNKYCSKCSASTCLGK